MADSQDFKSLQDQIQAALISTTKAASRLASEDLSFHRSFNPSVNQQLDKQTARLLSLGRSLLRSASSVSDIQSPTLQDLEDVETQWGGIVDVVDTLLEKADTSLDEYTGAVKRSSTAEQALVKSKQNGSSLSDVLRSQNILKPQLSFNNKPDNLDNSPWKPLLVSKPHAITSLEQSLGNSIDESQNEQFKHPYETEILQLNYPPFVFQTVDPVPYAPTESTSAIFVDTFEDVLLMLEELKTAQEIAVDLEHHDTRSYIGLVSLMQISTRNKDWIVDTLKPWRQDLQILNQVFADPRILKVFHGAFMDIVWLQRDLGLYVVGLFDTYHASQALHYPAGSLAYLLKRFVDFDADKKYQLADWRIRPLPDEMLFYARADTHYLLYIYDHMRNELLKQSNSIGHDESQLESVLRKSKETSLFRYERHPYDEKTGKGQAGWFQLLAKSSTLFTNEQFAVFRAIHSWRDSIARLEDDSPHFILSNRILFSLAKTVPTDLETLSGNLRSASHAAKSRAKDLLEIILAAKADGKNGPSMLEALSLSSNIDTAGRSPKTRMTGGIGTEDDSMGPLVADANINSLRSETSRFWGGAFGSSIWDTPKSHDNKSTHLQLAILQPRLSEEIFAASLEASHSNTSPGTPESSIPVKTKKRVVDIDESFTIKSALKRKSKDVEQDLSSGSAPDASIQSSSKAEADEERTESEEMQRRERKRAKRKEKKRAKQALKEEGRLDQEEAFDYSRAKPVLHAKKGSSKKPSETLPVDPYAKSADGPKGMRRLQSERPGKSLTFKG